MIKCELNEFIKHVSLGNSSTIFYNGELYDYNQLAFSLGLNSLGEEELVLTLWEREGIDSIKRLNGVFSMAIYDHRKEELWLIRDRFGVRPLFWIKHTIENRVYFSTSAKRLAKKINADIDLEYCARGLRYKAFEFPGSESPYKGVHSVAPGSWVRISLKKGMPQQAGRWYDLESAVLEKQVELSKYSIEKLQEKCFSLVEKAIKDRLQGVQPIALTLSGGLDSSTIAAFSSQECSDIRAFSYGSPESLESEGPEVARLAKELKIPVNYIWPQLSSEELKKLLLRTLSAQEAPFGGLSVLAQNQVFYEIAKTPYKVILGGQGGDEIFAGYRKFFIVAIKEALNNKQYGSMLKLIMSLGYMLFSELTQANIYIQALSRYKKNTNFSFELLNWSSKEHNLWGNKPFLSNRQIEDIQYWSIPSLLRFEYRNSTSNNLLTRLPFLDHELVEFALALPSTVKIAKGYGKWIMREITKNMVPKEIRLNRKKRGFDVTQTWIDDGLGDALRNIIISNYTVVKSHILQNINIEKALSNFSLTNNKNSLDEALMLAWLSLNIKELQ